MQNAMKTIYCQNLLIRSQNFLASQLIAEISFMNLQRRNGESCPMGNIENVAQSVKRLVLKDSAKKQHQKINTTKAK